MISHLKYCFRQLAGFGWKQRHRIVMGIRRIGNGLLWLYRRLPIPVSVRTVSKDIVFLTFEHFILRTSVYQSWLKQRMGAARIHALLTPGHLSGEEIKAEMPTAPSDEAWAFLPASAKKRGEHVPDAKVDIVLPVYRSYDQTLNCIYTVLSNPQVTPYELIVLNDFSPEPLLSAKLRELCDHGFFTLIENEENKGFVSTVNRGMRQHENRDVVLLNSDTEVYNDWLDRLVANAAANPRIGTVTPFSNNAEICSYPYFIQDNVMKLELSYAELDKLAAKANRGMEVELPTAIGFCMFIKRACLREVGYFDEVTFGKGYGEENDFCLRATAKGWLHTIAADIFVRHLGGTSFAGEKHKRIQKAIRTINRLYPHYSGSVQKFIASDPLRDARCRIDLARLKRLGREKNMLFICHQVGGGTGKHVRELTHGLLADGMGAFTLHPLNGTPGLLGLSHPDAPHLPNLYFAPDDDRELLKASLRELGITHMHVHHVIHFVPGMVEFLLLLAEEMGLSYDVTVHDYYFACPRINFIYGDGKFCGQPAIEVCENCIRTTPSHAGILPVWQWRRQFERLLAHARKVYVPDEDVALRMKQYFSAIPFLTRPHPEAPISVESLVAPREAGEVLRVGILGAISQIKGSEVIAALAKDAKARNLPIEFILIGYTDSAALNAGPDRLTITGAYREEELAGLLAQHKPHLLFIPTIIPESYCYTLSESWRYGIHPVVFDIGAQGARVKRVGIGSVLPLGLSEKPDELNNALLAVEISDKRAAGWSSNYVSLLRDYYELDDVRGTAAKAVA